MESTDVQLVRIRIGWTPTQMAQYLGYSLGHYVQCERGSRPFTSRAIMHAELLGCLHKCAEVSGLIKPQNVHD